MTLKTIYANIYDYPQYYDAIFAADCRREVAFLEACFDRYARRAVRRLFEPACGSGRLLAKLAQRGYEVAGNDLSRKAVAYCNRRLQRLGFPETAVVGDMAAFSIRPKADAAFNTINTFRLLPSDDAAEAHLRCMAGALRKGGIYVLGLHLTPPGEPFCDREIWSATRGTLHVESELVVDRLDRARREECMTFTLRVSTPKQRFQLVDRFVFRIYARKQFEALLSRVSTFELAATHNFSYDINEPVRVDDETEDVVYVLRKK